MERKKLNRISAVLLAAGFAASLVIYATAQPATVDPLLGNLLANKKYVHDLRVYGGRGNVLASEFMDDFADLWRGRTLAGTVAVLTAALTLAVRFVASLPEADASASSAKKHPPAAPL